MRKSKFAIALILTFTLLFTAHAMAGPVFDKILKKGELVVGNSGDQVPLSAKTKTGKIIGLDADIAKLMAGAMGVKLKLVAIPFPNLLPALEAGKIDMILSGMTITPRRNLKVVAVLICAALLSWPVLAEGETCNVPSASYPFIQYAVNAVTCTEIILASGSFFGGVTIGRTLELQGVSSDSTTVVGKVTVEGSGTKATLKGLKIAVGPGDPPPDGLVVVGDAEVIPEDLVVGLAELIFSDGFERGDTTAWSSTVQ